MNHPQLALDRAKPCLIAGERVFYCQFDPTIMITASDNVIKELTEVVFAFIYADGKGALGYISNAVLETFEPSTQITHDYKFKDFIEIDRDDPAVWE